MKKSLLSCMLMIVMLCSVFAVNVLAEEPFIKDGNCEAETQGFPLYWSTWKDNGDITKIFNIDKTVKYKGNMSLKIETSNGEYAVYYQYINLALLEGGKEYNARVYIKTKDVKNDDNRGAELSIIGKAGESSRLDVSSTPLSGTNDWKKVTVKFKMVEGCDSVAIGGRINNVESGTAWFDDFAVWPVGTAEPKDGYDLPAAAVSSTAPAASSSAPAPASSSAVSSADTTSKEESAAAPVSSEDDGVTDYVPDDFDTTSSTAPKNDKKDGADMTVVWIVLGAILGAAVIGGEVYLFIEVLKLKKRI